MVKNITLIISALTLVACDIYKSFYTTNKCGMYRESYSIPKIDDSFYKICDTAAVYLYDGQYMKNREDKLHYSRLGIRNYYKFYANGKVGYFGMKDKEPWTKDRLNPCYFIDAYYGKNLDGKLILKRMSMTTANGPIGYEFFINFKKDTLEIIDKSLIQEGYKHIYIKQKLPKEWLVYKPDW
jgi:hypothetical protein